MATLQARITALAQAVGADIKAILGKVWDGTSTKPTPVDADGIGIYDSSASSAVKRMTFANLKAWIAGLFVSRTSAQIDGNLNITGTARRITGDFSHATVANRTMFQTNVANSNTIVEVIPNGTGSISQFNLGTSSDPNNTSILAVLAGSGLGEVRIASAQRGTGAYFPLTFHTGGAERMRIDPATGNVTAISGALGYGVGAGGTAVQSPNNTSTVILNKPNGVITLANGSIAGAARIVFALQNSLIDTNSIVVAHGVFDGASAAIEHLTVQVGYAQPGYAIISVKNNATGDIATNGVKIRFAVFAGSSS